MKLTINNRTYDIAFAENDTAKAFQALLPKTFRMAELNGNEKYVHLPTAIRHDASRVPHGIHCGDLLLYSADCLVLFYKDFSTTYSYVRLGSLLEAEDLKATIGNGDIEARFTRD